MRIKTNNGNAFPGLQSRIIEQNWETEQVQIPPSAYSNLKTQMLCIGGFLFIIVAIYTGTKILLKVIKSAHYRNTERPIITINPITPSAPLDTDMSGSLTSPTEIPNRTNNTIQEITQLNSRMELFAKYKANSINQVINLYNLMGSNIEDTTQNILDDYLEDTLEMNEIPDDMNLPYQEARLM